MIYKDLCEIFDEEYNSRRFITALGVAEGMAHKGYTKVEWISVDDKLPDKNGKYLCCTHGTIRILGYSAYRPQGFYDYDSEWGFAEVEVTHWMPLPEMAKVTE